MSKEENTILQELDTIIEPIADKFENREDTALFTLGCHATDGEENNQLIQTYIMMVGYFDILAEGLYSELKSQIEQDNLMMFSMFREVIRDLEQELGLDPDDEIDSDNIPATIH